MIISKYVKNIYFQFVESIIEYVVHLDKIFIEIFHLFMLYSPTHKITSLILTLFHIHQKMKMYNLKMKCYVT
jgi:hypothetical protein